MSILYIYTFIYNIYLFICVCIYLYITIYVYIYNIYIDVRLLANYMHQTHPHIVWGGAFATGDGSPGQSSQGSNNARAGGKARGNCCAKRQEYRTGYG